ncbi:MAG TPA: VOC family protein [Acidobacteriaceae bacterium]|nr:VOC family protein [Acidobacteriaceae bacterium]
MATAEQTVTSTITWFEIPAADFGRAVRFYETIFASPLRHEAAWPNLAIFPYERPGVSGAIAYGEGFRPTGDGVVIYLNCDGRIDEVLGRVEKAGGSVVEPKNHLPSVGWVAQIRDSEGNRVGLHAAA